MIARAETAEEDGARNDLAAPPPLNVTCLFVRRPHFGQHSGIQQLVRHLDPAKVRVTARPVSDHDGDLPSRWPWRSTRSRNALRRVVSSVGPGWYKLSDFAAEMAIAPAWWRFETKILHFIDGEHTANLLPWLARHVRSRGRTVATYHQAPRLLSRLVPWPVIERLDHVVLVAESQRSWFEQVLPPDRVSVILHGVDAQFFHPVPRHASRTVRCLVVGSYLRDWKLLAGIADAMRDDPSMVFDVVSSSAPRFTSPSVSVHQHISDEALRDIYQRADILLLPLEDATANNALVEGMASGLPVIGSDLPSLREYAGTAGNFVEHRVDAFVEAIRTFARDADLRARLGCVARTRAEALSWPNVAGMYEALYERVATRGRGVLAS